MQQFSGIVPLFTTLPIMLQLLQLEIAATLRDYGHKKIIQTQFQKIGLFCEKYVTIC